MDEVAIVPVDSALRIFNRTSLFRILAEVRNHLDIERAQEQTVAVLTERHGEEDITVLTQDAVLATFGRILSILTAALAGIAAISLSVAGVGIMNVMLVSVSERTREIGLLKALGGTQRQILTVFLIEAALISTGGGLLGLGIGIGIGQIAQQIFPDFPVQPPVWAVVAAVGVSASVGLIFGGVPARNASRLDPVEALMRQRT
jgi:putative ABC transport system permease protein